MEAGTPNGTTRRGFLSWRRILLFLVASPLLLFFLGNLAMTSPWSRKWVATKIGQRIGLDTSMGSLTWSPWNGLSVGQLKLLQPTPLRATLTEPLVNIGMIKVDLDWQSILKGKIAAEAVELDTPRVVLPLELVSHFAKPTAPPQTHLPVQQPPVTTTQTPALAINGDQPAPPSTESIEIPNSTAPPAAVIDNPQTATAPTPPAPQPEKPEEQKPTPPPFPQRRYFRLGLRDASFSLVLGGKNLSLLELKGITGSVPLGGDAASSPLKISEVRSLDHPVFSGIDAMLDWTSPFLSLRPIELGLHGTKMNLVAKFARLPGYEFLLQAQLPDQKPNKATLPFQAEATAETIAARAQLRGYLLAPASWQGDFLAGALALGFKMPGQSARFDQSSIVTILRNGVLSTPDARLVGDNFSLLGNATILADGRCAGVLRVVAPPESVQSTISRFFPNLNASPVLTPLATPQRAAFDLEASGDISQLFLQFGKDGPIMNLKL